jgi:nucleoside-diphosphate-sugar epimerase
MKKVLITGSLGQIGSELMCELHETLGAKNVIASDVRKPSKEILENCNYEKLDVLKPKQIFELCTKYKIDTIYHLAAILSATGEKNPGLAWKVNMDGFYNVLEVARELKINQVICPSSIAAFGPDTPAVKTPNDTILRPSTMYGVTKVAGELLGNYYVRKFDMDIRGMRFPGIISYKTPPGGGTTDYAVEIYYEALKAKSYTCFVKENTTLPMMYMPDAIKALIKITEADKKKLKHFCDFNVTAMSFSAGELAAEIKKHIPDFKISYKPDFRQQIADSWPQSLDDTAARKEWGWKPTYDLKKMTSEMLEKLREKLGKEAIA